MMMVPGSSMPPRRRGEQGQPGGFVPDRAKWMAACAMQVPSRRREAIDDPGARLHADGGIAAHGATGKRPGVPVTTSIGCGRPLATRAPRRPLRAAVSRRRSPAW